LTVETTELSLPSRIETVAAAAGAVAEFISRSGISDDAAFGIDMAVREAVTNAVLHGNRQDDTMTRAPGSIPKKSQTQQLKRTS
jgi:anti-sigma regulatory factor (Ser/Thr protein kinase)